MVFSVVNYSTVFEIFRASGTITSPTTSRISFRTFRQPVLDSAEDPEVLEAEGGRSAGLIWFRTRAGSSGCRPVFSHPLRMFLEVKAFRNAAQNSSKKSLLVSLDKLWVLCIQLLTFWE